MINTQELRSIAAASTRVVLWYASGDTVKGPFMRWFKCTEVDPSDESKVAPAEQDVKFAAYAMNNLVPLLDEVAHLEGELKAAVMLLRQGKIQFAPHTTNSFVDEFLNKHKDLV